ncbi:MAG: hypothetical protein WC045_02745 [Patescibacteria group bacterium]
MKKNFLKVFFISALFAISTVTVFSLPMHVYAANDVYEYVGPTKISCSSTDPFSVFKELTGGATPITEVDKALNGIACLGLSLVNFLSEMAVLVAAIYITISGIKYQTSSGDPKKQQAAISALQAALIGFALSLSFVAIINYALNFIEFDTLTGQFKSVNVEATKPADTPAPAAPGTPDTPAPQPTRS